MSTKKTTPGYDRYYDRRPFDLPTRRWASRQLVAHPEWVSVDLRDGNQALVNPMGLERKLALYDLLLDVGFSGIELGFPAASDTDYTFVRHLIENKLIPSHALPQVLVQCREDLLLRTFEALEGIDRAVVHFYNSTSEAQRRLVFATDKPAIVDLAVEAALLCKGYSSEFRGELLYEYSPESFTGTEPEFAVEIVEAVADALGASRERQLIVNLPATVEHYTPNVYADVIEWFCDALKDRSRYVVSLHPHNDRGTAVAAAELGLLAGADRVEGTLFGNGERTGNVDVVTLALNLYSQGVDPGLDLSDIERIRRVAEYATEMDVHPRHPYAGDLVYTAFSGSHQDAIKKGLAAQGSGVWEVPYLPIDPAATGREYEAIIRVNSQSGKAGVAYILEQETGYVLPRELSQAVAKDVQSLADSSGAEVTGGQITELFFECYADPNVSLHGYELRSLSDGITELSAQFVVAGEIVSVHANGSGPLAAALAGLSLHYATNYEVVQYDEHALGAGKDAQAVAYVGIVNAEGIHAFGVGTSSSIVGAGLLAVMRAVARVQEGAQ